MEAQKHGLPDARHGETVAGRISDGAEPILSVNNTDTRHGERHYQYVSGTVVPAGNRSRSSASST